jgi:hypothetical protein
VNQLLQREKVEPIKAEAAKSAETPQ